MPITRHPELSLVQDRGTPPAEVLDAAVLAVVTTKEQATAAAALARGTRDLSAFIKGQYEAQLKAAQATVAEIKAARDKHLEPLAEAEEILRRKLLSYAGKSAELPSGVGVRRSWTYRVVDESVIPREYWAVDHDRLKKLVKAWDGCVQIPGVEVFQDEGLVLRDPKKGGA